MRAEDYEAIRRALLVAESKCRLSAGVGTKYWQLHVREAQQLIDNALIQLEYARKAATPGDKRNG